MLAEKLAPVITIDGPSGVGKGTVGKWLANRLNWNFLDSGAIYRIFAVHVRENDLISNDVNCIKCSAKDAISNMFIRFEVNNKNDKIFLNEKDVTVVIRTEQISELASKLAVIQEVRDVLLETQRSFRAWPGLVADGRDMGSHVFPDANYKFFLDASVEERVKRRYHQLMSKKIGVKLSPLAEELVARDKRDSERVASPMVPADDAIIIDTTCLSVNEVELYIWDVIAK